MSNDAAILDRLVQELAKQCRYCQCFGDSCKLATGERCELVGEMQARCNAPACERAHFFGLKDAARDQERKDARARREAAIPPWIRARKANDAKCRKNKRTKTKGRAA